MPEWFNDILVVNKDELVPQFWKTYDSLAKQIRRYKDVPYGITQVQKGGKYRRSLIAFDSLPPDVQDAIGDPRKHDHILEAYFEWDGDAVHYYYNEFTYSDGSRLRDETREQYIINASVLTALNKLRDDRIAERKSKNGKIKGIDRTFYEDAISFNDTLKSKWEVKHNLPGNYKRFKERWRAFNTIGYLGLVKDADKKRAANPKKVTEDTIKLLNDLFSIKDKKPTPTQVAYWYDAFIKGNLTVTNTDTGEEYNTDNFKPISQDTIKKYLKRWENRIGTYKKRSGNSERLQSQFRPHHTMEQPKWAGSILSIDDRQPPFEMPNGKRPWFYNGIDLASECFTVWAFGETKAGIIMEFYRNLLRNYMLWGFKLPLELEAEKALNNDFTNTFLQNGAMFRNVRILANNPRGKRIEAYFRQLRYKLEKERAGWLARPFAESEPNQVGPGQKITKTSKEIFEECREDFKTWNDMEHSRVKGISRWEYQCKYQRSDIQDANWPAILPYLGNRTPSSCNAGIIKSNYGEVLLGHNGQISTDDELINLMSKVEGKNVDVYWLDDYEGNTLKALIYQDGRYVCEGVPKPTYNRATYEQTQEDQDNINLMNAYDNTITHFQKQSAKGIDSLTIEDHQPKTLNDNFQFPGERKKQEEPEEETETEDLGEANAEPEEETSESETSHYSWDDKFRI